MDHVIGKILLISRYMVIIHVIQKEVGFVCRGHIKRENTKRVPVRDVSYVITQVKKHKVNIYPYLYTNMVLHPHYKRPNKNHPLTYYIWQLYVHKAWNRLS